MRVLLLLSVFLVACSGPASTAPPEQARVEARLSALLAAAVSPDASVGTLAPFLVARGDNPDRRWKAPTDLTNASERAFAEEASADLMRLMQRVRQPDGALAYEIEEFVMESESEGLWHVLEVEFEAPQGEVTALFAFLPVGGSFLLGEIEV